VQLQKRQRCTSEIRILCTTNLTLQKIAFRECTRKVTILFLGPRSNTLKHSNKRCTSDLNFWTRNSIFKMVIQPEVYILQNGAHSPVGLWKLMPFLNLLTKFHQMWNYYDSDVKFLLFDRYPRYRWNCCNFELICFIDIRKKVCTKSKFQHGGCCNFESLWSDVAYLFYATNWVVLFNVKEQKPLYNRRNAK